MLTRSVRRLIPFIGKLFRLGAREDLFHLRSQTLHVGIDGPDGEIPGRQSARRVLHGLKGTLQFQESAIRQLKTMLVGMIDRAYRKVFEWSLRLLNVIPQNVGHRLVFEKRDQPLSTGLVYGKA